jgi:hypothetical protein
MNMSSVPIVVTKGYSNRGKIKFLMVLAGLCGLIFFVQAIPVISSFRAPVVEGSVVSRELFRLYEVLPRVNFTIQIDGKDAKVHAITGKYLLDEVPNKVRFRYSGDPAKDVFLFEYEENPVWIFLFCWGISAVCYLVLCFPGKSLPDLSSAEKAP